ncbi:MAG: hypothetical protein LUD47_07715 [Clostridia bacterium]|nr:hypothetical protein [Clostridia bacterium]
MAEKKLSRKKLLDILKRHLKTFRKGGNEDKMNDEMFDLASEYGFKSDHGNRFSEKYCNSEEIPNGDDEEFKKVLATCDSWKDLGGLYFSYWREVTHFDEYDDPFSEENVKVFSAIIKRLIEVLEKKGE